MELKETIRMMNSADYKERFKAEYFQNVIPKSLWPSVEQAYSNGAYEKGYVTQALETLEMENFAIQLQVDDIGGGYYRIYHSIVTW